MEIAHNRIVSGITYRGQFPGPLLRVKEGQRVVVDVSNDTDTLEQLHWHGQVVPTDVDGAAKEGTPYIAAHGMRRIAFTPRPSGFRFYHTHNRAGADPHAGQYISDMIQSETISEGSIGLRALGGGGTACVKEKGAKVVSSRTARQRPFSIPQWSRT